VTEYVPYDQFFTVDVDTLLGSVISINGVNACREQALSIFTHLGECIEAHLVLE
jgi:hypothetical protein